MGAEGARITYPYLSGQWTEQEQCDDTFMYRYICRCSYGDDYTNLFSQPEYILYALAFLFTYLNVREKCIKRKR